MMKIAIGTLNRAKTAAVRRVALRIWKDAEFVNVGVLSGVKPQPMSDEEGIRGATNRAKNAMNAVKGAAYGIGLEGAVQENAYGMFLGGWVAVMDRRGNVGIGSSGRVMLPGHISKGLKKGGELGPIMQGIMKDGNDEIRHTIGTVGVLTAGLTSRTEGFEEAMKLALAPFISKGIYKKR